MAVSAHVRANSCHSYRRTTSATHSRYAGPPCQLRGVVLAGPDSGVRLARCTARASADRLNPVSSPSAASNARTSSLDVVPPTAASASATTSGEAQAPPPPPPVRVPPSCPPGSSSRRAVALSLGAAAAAAALPLLPVAPSRADEGGSGRRFGAQATSPAGQLERDAALAAGAAAGEDDQPPPKPRRERRAVAAVPTVALAPGLRVSKVIRGTWQLSGRHTGDSYTDRTRGGEAVSDLAAFARAGITSLDTADNYGPAEALIGQYLRLHPWNSPATTIATKLSYINEEQMAGVSRTLVEYAVRSCLVRTGRQRVDLVQLQWADTARYRKWLDVLKWLAELREQGMIGHIGLCNFDVPSLAKAMDARVGVVSNQVQYSLIDRRPALYMQQAAQAYGVQLIAYGTLAGGLIADKYYGVAAGKVRLDTASKQKYGTLLHQVGTPPGGLAGGAAVAGGGSWAFMQEVLGATRAVGERHGGVSSSAVALAWVLQQPQVAAAVVGARNALHIRDMQVACALKLDDADMLDLDAVWEGAPNPPTSDIYVWERGGAWAV
ncbi:hypothetical protein CHLRE_02g095127v5 [Chlamydomonas reinhardtii]|uniref:NADP-dependent oxidoreductase domain-containing protein n=1 Tax=Chlamydomonas reinhardtii TaxID=3055 RepID=A0A2K3E1T8_CHLRE|nr:uncharacterized protein CHLRE_02g095127v5 [Chlamydomonas reinhardtii]PNW86744.1 hypothetical protein CHLRE_02g095127v5 [Chlamydomonas reinhardtii]